MMWTSAAFKGVCRTIVARRRIALMMCIMFLCVGVMGCTVMDTTPVGLTADGRCHSALGSYSLPKTLLRIEVRGNNPDPSRAQTVISALEEVTIPDRTYCLDYLASSTSADDISIVRGDPPGPAPVRRTNRTSTQLLTFVSSHAVDYTADIIRRLIRTIFVALSGAPNFKPVARANVKVTAKEFIYTLADHSFDPFNLEAVSRLNRDLRPLGYCLQLETPYFDPTSRSAERYCADPASQLRDGARFAEAYALYQSAEDLPATVPGIIYRPRQPYRLYLYANDDVDGSQSRWYLVRTLKVMLENASPVISVGVQRAAFVARRTAMVFDRGTLIGMCVSKNSELLAAVEIPLEIVRSVVALPTQILQVKIDDITKTNQLVSAETALIKLQRQYLDFLADPTKAKPNDGQQKDTSFGGYDGGPGAAFAAGEFQTEDERKAPLFDNLNGICTAPTGGTVAKGTGDQKG